MRTATGDKADVSLAKIVAGVMLGVLFAVAVIAIVYKNTGPSSAECGVQLLEEASGKRSSAAVDDACR